LPGKRQKVARPVAFCGFDSESPPNGLEHLHVKRFVFGYLLVLWF